MATVALSVPVDFDLPEWYARADPDDTANILALGPHLVSFLRDRAGDQRQDQLLRTALERVLHGDDSMRVKLDHATREWRLARERHETYVSEESVRVKEATRALSRQLEEKTRREETLRSDVEAEVRSSVGKEMDASRSRVEALETELRKRLTDHCAATERFATERANDATTISALRARVTELERPTGLGRAGETDVADILRNAGFSVQDTSMGECKEQGYLDLLVRPEGDDATTGNLRLAIEIKNVKAVEKRDRDGFERKVKHGLTHDMFDAALFLSLRTDTRRGGGSAVTLDMFHDDGARPLAPVTWLGTERGRNPAPVTQEQIETHVCMQFALLEQCHRLKQNWSADADQDEDARSIQTLFDDVGTLLNETFVELSKQHKLVEDVKASLTAVRVKCITLFTSVWQTNREVGWLKRPLHAPWMEAYQTARGKAVTQKDSDIWNAFARNKSAIERQVGKDALFLAVRQDLNRNGKRPPAEDEE